MADEKSRMIDSKYLESKFDDIKEYDVSRQREIVSTLLKYKILQKDVSKYWKIKCNQIKMAIYRGYKIPVNELQLLELSETLDDSEDMDESKNLIYFYAFIAHRWDYIRKNMRTLQYNPISFKILFYQTYMSCMYYPFDSNNTNQSEYYKIKVQVLPKTPMYVYYTYSFTQDYISNLALNLEYYNEEHDRYSCCIISDMKPKKNDVVKINDYKTIIENINSEKNISRETRNVSLLFSFMSISEFILDVFSHILNPEINIIDSESKKDLIERQTPSGKVVKRYTPDQLPQILRTDIVGKYLNMKLGNIITIDNVNLVFESITPASRTVRVCTNTDIIKKSR
jgi:DNA-directed RNA polymerase subunit H (RpoH/RPB5)